MKFLRHYGAMHGQAGIEAILALALLALFMHGLATVGALQMRGLHAAQLSRHAAFAAARGQRELPHWNGATISAMHARHVDAGLLAGDAQAAGLARDWLRTGAHLRVAQARVHAEHRPVFVRRDEPAARLPMQRQTVLAENAGHAHGEAATVQRLALSPPGWSAAAQRSQAAAQALQRRMQQVDAPWGRGRWSVDWLGAWADLGPSAPRER